MKLFTKIIIINKIIYKKKRALVVKNKIFNYLLKK